MTYLDAVLLFNSKKLSFIEFYGTLHRKQPPVLQLQSDGFDKNLLRIKLTSTQQKIF